MCRCICWICGLLASLIVCLAGRGDETTQPAQGPATQPQQRTDIEFASDTYGFRLRFPDSLRQLERDRANRSARDEAGIALVLVRPESDPGGSQAFIEVASPPDVRGGMSLEETARTHLETQKRGMTNARVLGIADATLGGSPAKRVVIEGHQVQDGRVRRLQVIAAQHNDRLFTVLCSAEPQGFDSLKQDCERIIESFQWMK